MESFPTFQKLWGRVYTKLEKGAYNIVINNSKITTDIFIINLHLDYDVRKFNGKKFLVLETSSVLGTSSFFGYTLIIAGCYSFIVFIVLLGLYIKNDGSRYDYSELKWS